MAVLVGLGHAAKRSTERFAVACEAAGFAPRQCAFLAELDRHSSDAADDAATANVWAANANVQALTHR